MDKLITCNVALQPGTNSLTNKLEYNCKEFHNPNYLVVSKAVQLNTKAHHDPSIFKQIENSLRKYHTRGKKIKIP